MDSEQISEYINRFEAVTFTVNRKLGALIRDSIDVDLTLDQFLILRYIGRRGVCTASELSESFSVNKSATTAITSRLVNKQYIRRVPDSIDRRVIGLTLTEQGRTVYETAAERVNFVLAGYISRFSQEEIDQFLYSFERLAELMQSEGWNVT